MSEQMWPKVLKKFTHMIRCFIDLFSFPPGFIKHLLMNDLSSVHLTAASRKLLNKGNQHSIDLNFYLKVPLDMSTDETLAGPLVLKVQCQYPPLRPTCWRSSGSTCSLPPPCPAPSSRQSPPACTRTWPSTLSTAAWRPPTCPSWSPPPTPPSSWRHRFQSTPRWWSQPRWKK